jgi:hypothetical protein
MLLKVIIVFLGLMVLIALVGRALFPSVLPRAVRRKETVSRCAACGRPRIGRKPCDCGRSAG